MGKITLWSVIVHAILFYQLGGMNMKYRQYGSDTMWLSTVLITTVVPAEELKHFVNTLYGWKKKDCYLIIF